MASIPIVSIEDSGKLENSIADVLSALPEDSKVRRGERVFLKPNLTYPIHRPGVTTRPQFLRAAVRAFQDLGADVMVGESDGGYGAWSANLAFEGHGLPQICQELGATLVNLTEAEAITVELPGAGVKLVLDLPKVLVEEVDAFVTLPVPKIHSVTHYSGAVKNQWGCIPDPMRLKRHPDFNQLIWAINDLLAPRLVLGDAEYLLDENGPMFGTPVHMGRTIGSNDVLAFDRAVATHIMGLDEAQIPYLQQRIEGYEDKKFELQDRSTGPRHQFTLRRSVRNRAVAWAFTRQWAIDLIWDSSIGRAAHRALYAITGDVVARDKKRMGNFARSHD